MFHSFKKEQLSGIISQVTYILNFRSAFFFHLPPFALGPTKRTPAAGTGYSKQAVEGRACGMKDYTQKPENLSILNVNTEANHEAQ